VDWLVPGILGMNMMFSCLFGVGYVVVRYRKSGFLRRLSATPLTATEFGAAQILSRLLLTIGVSSLLYGALALLVPFRNEGQVLVLLVIAIAGAMSMIAFGFMMAARIASEELANGVINLASWPMMLLSGVWFSLEGAPEWLQQAARVLPLTQMLEAARAVMLDGAGLAQIWPQIGWLGAMTILFLAIAATGFRWRPD
jgi:ABC-type multidrug transport system permease subunit